MMADAMALEEQQELDAMISMYESDMPSSAISSQPPTARPNSLSLSDDEYDDLFLDLVTQQEEINQDFASSSQMDMS